MRVVHQQLTYFNSLYFTLLQFTSLHFTSLHFTSFYFTLLHFASLRFTLLYFIILYFTLLYFTLRYFTLLYLLTPWSRVLLEKLTGFQLFKKLHNFMEHEGSLLHSQVPATCPYPETARSSPYPYIPLPEKPS